MGALSRHVRHQAEVYSEEAFIILVPRAGDQAGSRCNCVQGGDPGYA